jgi:hypothetical protein
MRTLAFNGTSIKLEHFPDIVMGMDDAQHGAYNNVK